MKRQRLTDKLFLKTGLMFGAALLLLQCPVAAAVQTETKAPSTEERAELAKHASYTGYIHLIESNEGNGLFEFLKANTGKSVFIDSSVLRYSPAPEGLTEDQRDRIAPTDRFENPVVKNCWGKEIDRAGRLASGETGFPLPENAADIESGCKTRIALDLADDGHGGNLQVYRGFDKNEIFFAGFFAVKAEELPGGKTLYRLTEAREGIEEKTMQAFYAYATVKDRPFRKLEIETDEDQAAPAVGDGKGQ
jgi:hypothetical protein